jgi:hypothetical protein
MKPDIDIYLLGAGIADEKTIRIPGDAFVHELIEAAKRQGFAAVDIEIFVEDGEEALNRDARLCDIGIGHKHRLHCHHCKKIEVTVHFNGEAKSKHFGPGQRVKGVLKWALNEFGLQGVDADNKELRLNSAEGKALTSHQHIGSFVHPPHCHLELFLTAIVEVQG